MNELLILKEMLVLELISTGPRIFSVKFNCIFRSESKVDQLILRVLFGVVE